MAAFGGNDECITKLERHVAFLTSEKLAGRATGSLGEALAMQYAESYFKKIGLRPAGAKQEYLQTFSFISHSILGANNHLCLTRHDHHRQCLARDQWRPLRYSKRGAFTIRQLVFVGSGITVPGARDDYQGLNVKGKWVLVKDALSAQLTAKQRRLYEPYLSTRYKTYNAKRHGAQGIIFVTQKKALADIDRSSLKASGIFALVIDEKIVESMTAHELKSGAITLSTPMLGQIDICQKRKTASNVIAKLVSGKKNAPLVIIGAHADHLGKANAQSYYAGADDNASGVAAVLEAAAKLKKLQMRGNIQLNNDVLFAIWSGEEIGLLGSTYFVKNFLSKKQPALPTVKAYLNLDMVGRLRQKLVLQGTGSSAGWQPLIDEAIRRCPLPLLTKSDPYLPTDATIFYLHGIPTLNFFTGAHQEYHTVKDQYQRLNFSGMEKITQLLTALIVNLTTTSQPLTYQHVKNKPQVGGVRKVYLGTVPDYASAINKGVQLAGVKRGSPAAIAGLKPNDVIVSLAGAEIDDIYDYAYALKSLPVGKPVSLVVLRQQAPLHLTIVAASHEPLLGQA